MIITLKLIYHLFYWPLHLKCGGNSNVSKLKWVGRFDPQQAGRKKTLLWKPEISAAGQIIIESLILINIYWYAKLILVKSYLIQLERENYNQVLRCYVWVWKCGAQCFWSSCRFTVPSQWAGEAAEWPASTDPPEQPWCSAVHRPSDRKHCSWRTSPSSATEWEHKEEHQTIRTNVSFNFSSNTPEEGIPFPCFPADVNFKTYICSILRWRSAYWGRKMRHKPHFIPSQSLLKFAWKLSQQHFLACVPLVICLGFSSSCISAAYHLG